MKITSLNCNNCGANLEIQPKVKFFTCKFCKSALTIKNSGNVVYTEVLEEIKDNTDTLLDNSAEMLIEKKIARLDREWALERKKYDVIDHSGEFAYLDETPQTNIGIYLALAVGWFIFAIIISQFNMDIGNQFLMIVLGAIIFIVMGFNFGSIDQKKERYKKAKNVYLNKRNDLLKQIEQ